MRRSVWERCMSDGCAFTRQYRYDLVQDFPFGSENPYVRRIVRRPLMADRYDTADFSVVWVLNPLDPDSHIGL